MQLEIMDMGRVSYTEGDAMQAAAAGALRPGTALLLLGEHDPVYTRTVTSLSPPHVGIPVVGVRRGGEITYHGPGQLIGRPVAPWRSGFTRVIEDALGQALLDVGVGARLRERLPGVWVGERKIASVGFRQQDGLVMEGGFAVNVNVDLEPFDAIEACGIAGVQMTSIAAETGVRDHPDFRGHVVERLSAAFQALGE